MISSNDFRPGVTVEIDGNVWQVVDFQHVKPGKGAAFVRTKMKNLQTGSVVERTFNAGEKVPKAHVDRRRMQYLYESDGSYTFMDNETYDQVELTLEQLGDAKNFLLENMEVSKADMIVSLAGRDKGQLFFVVDTDEQYVYLADGKGRRLESPKRKKRRHVRKLPLYPSRVAEKLRNGDKVLNSELRRELAVFGQTFNSQNQGG